MKYLKDFILEDINATCHLNPGMNIQGMGDVTMTSGDLVINKKHKKKKSKNTQNLQQYTTEKLKISDVTAHKSKFKQFSQVKVGDLGVNYNGVEARVIDKGTVAEMQKYDKFGIIAIAMRAGSITKDDDAVAIELKDGYTVCTYGENGFLAYR